MILLFSAAITIFILWISNQAIGNSPFKELPDWVVGASRGIWTSLTTGVAGIGLAVIKAFGRPEPRRPNYLLYVGVTTACMFVPITAVAYIHHRDHPIIEPAKVDPHVYRINTASTDEREFEINNSPASATIQYRIRGLFFVHGDVVKIHIASVDVHIAPYVRGPGPVRLTGLRFWGSYFKNVDGRDQLMQTSQAIEPSAVLDVDMAVKANESKHLGPADLSFRLPSNEDLSRLWLSGGIRTDMGGYLPFEWN